jgi:hypothetical protein
MTRLRRTSHRLVRLLRPSPEGSAAAAAPHDPGLLLALQAARARDAARWAAR